MGGILKSDRCVLMNIGGMPDHVHLIVSMHPQISLSDMMRALKAKSSKWVHETFPERRDFAWQTGYGAFAVSHSNVDKVAAYIRDQEAHHKRISFRDELIALLHKHGVEYDERYI